jgi:molybdenum cofactor biosynthesis enzyme MoaA
MHHVLLHVGPTGDHGAMSPDDWARIIDEAAALGVRRVTMIGGDR